MLRVFKGFDEKNTRPGIPHIAIILTDGMSQNVSNTIENALLMHEKGITVFVIGKSFVYSLQLFDMSKLNLRVQL
jgi:hypothetical protein